MALKSNEARGEVFECFGDKLKKLREEKGMTQAELSKELNTSKTSIANYEGGTRKVPLDIIVKISKYFSVSVDDLLDIPFPKKNKDIFSDIISNNHEFIKQIEAWDKEIGTFIFTKENHDKLISFAKFLKEQQLKEETKINSHT